MHCLEKNRPEACLILSYAGIHLHALCYFSQLLELSIVGVVKARALAVCNVIALLHHYGTQFSSQTKKAYSGIQLGAYHGHELVLPTREILTSRVVY